MKGFLNPPDKAGDVNLPTLLREWVVDGLLLDFPLLVPPTIREVLDRQDLPAIWINSKKRFNAVHPDDFGEAKSGTKYLLGKGHRRIAYVNPRYRSDAVSGYEHYSARDRQDGYETAMRDAGLQPWVVKSELSDARPEKHDHRKVYRDLYRQSDRPTAIICYSNGVEAYMSALELQINVPDELSILAFSNQESGTPDVCVSRLVVPFGAMGAEAARMVMQKVAEPETPLACKTIPFGTCDDRTIATLNTSDQKQALPEPDRPKSRERFRRA